MASDRQNGETLQEYRDRLNCEFDAKFPGLAKLKLNRPLDAQDDLWFEIVTGETIPPDETCVAKP